MSGKQHLLTPLTPPMASRSRFNADSASSESDIGDVTIMSVDTSDDSLPTTPITPISPPQHRKRHPVTDSPTVVPGLNVGLELGPQVGKGAFSRTYRGTDSRTGYVYAVKCRRGTTDVSIFRHERDILLVVSPHPSVVRFHPRFSISADYLVLDFYDTDLNEHVRQLQRSQLNMASSNSIDEMFAYQRQLSKPVPCVDRWKSWAQQLIAGLRHLRACRVIHGDIKPENVLVRDNGKEIVLADFSSAQFAVPRDQPGVFACSDIYSAPEVRYGGSPSFGSDTYSCGLVLAYCASGEAPYAAAKNPQQRTVWMDRIHPLDAYEAESQSRLRDVRQILDMFLNRTPVEEISQVL